MFRGPQILTWPHPIRSLLLLRESHLAALSETWAACHAARHPKERRYEGICGSKNGSLSTTQTVSCFGSVCSNRQLGEASRPYTQSFCKVQTAKSKLASNPWKCTVVEDLSQITKAVSTVWDCLSNRACLQARRLPWDICQHSYSFPYKTRCTRLQYYRQHFARSFSLSKLFRIRSQHYSLSFHQTRAVHQAAPHVSHAWRDCLSLENENRCRQSLGPNLRLYEVEKGRKEARQSQGKNQGKWASVLVSLCCVGGEPAFLFTLRSSTLKGRHKGDVSFAGGKSDPSDRDVVATALREAREELGVNVATERVWGVLKPLRDMSGMTIAPVLANVGPFEELPLKPNPGEVEEIFTLSLSHLCNPQNRGYTHFRTGNKYGYTVPVFHNGKHRVWGLTAIALDQTLKLIVPS